MQAFVTFFVGKFIWRRNFAPKMIIIHHSVRSVLYFIHFLLKLKEIAYYCKIKCVTLETKELKRLPLSILTFEKLVNNNCLDVDKTEFIYKMINHGSYIFMSRPRRFGKSLFVSNSPSIFWMKDWISVKAQGITIIVEIISWFLWISNISDHTKQNVPNPSGIIIWIGLTILQFSILLM